MGQILDELLIWQRGPWHAGRLTLTGLIDKDLCRSMLRRRSRIGARENNNFAEFSFC